MLISLIVAIISQCILKHQVIQFEHIQFLCQLYLNKDGKKLIYDGLLSK